MELVLLLLLLLLLLLVLIVQHRLLLLLLLVVVVMVMMLLAVVSNGRGRLVMERRHLERQHRHCRSCLFELLEMAGVALHVLLQVIGTPKVLGAVGVRAHPGSRSRVHDLVAPPVLDALVLFGAAWEITMVLTVEAGCDHVAWLAGDGINRATREKRGVARQQHR